MAYIDQNAKSYGDAIFMLAEELGQTEEIKEDLNVVCDILSQNTQYLELLDTPALPRDERVKILGEAFGKLNTNLVSLCKILAERRMAYLIFKIRDCYIDN